MRGKTPPPGWDGSQPHPDAARERFSRSVSMGMASSQAYAKHLYRKTGEVNKDSLKSSGHVVRRETMVAQRIEWLRRERAEQRDVPEELTADLLDELMQEVSTCLEDAHRACEASGVASPSELSRLRKILVIHAGRITRSTTPKSESETVPADCELKLVPDCVCHV